MNTVINLLRKHEQKKRNDLDAIRHSIQLIEAGKSEAVRKAEDEISEEVAEIEA